MRILHLIPPGRLPTVVIDPGTWWDVVASGVGHQLSNHSANFHFWTSICSQDVAHKLLAGLSRTQRWRRLLEWKVEDFDPTMTAEPAAQALRDLRSVCTYQSASNFQGAAEKLTNHLAALNHAQTEFEVSLSQGLRIVGLDYNDSRALLEYSLRDGILARLVEDALAGCATAVDFIAITVTSAESLLCAMVAARLLRRSNPGVHLCLADHGYENFSLHAHIHKLQRSGAIEQAFDTIIEAKDERDLILPRLIEAIAAGNFPRGFVTSKSFAATPAATPRRVYPPLPLPTFTPEPVLFTRLSPRRCYWSRCTFCTQNTKYDDPKAASRLEVHAALDRLAILLRAGYRNIVFSDEAISPSTLKLLCEEIIRRELVFKWTCRCRLELAHTRDLFKAMRDSGCYEVLFGLESISPRVQRLMDKHLDGMDEPRVKRIFSDMQEAGLAVHVTMIAGFPGDTLDESGRTVEFVIDVLREARSATFYLNAFSLFPDTVVAREPARFGISRVDDSGDMPSRFDFEFDAGTQATTGTVLANFSRLNDRLTEGLGWYGLGKNDSAKAVQTLYFTSGCGSILKTLVNNPYGTPLTGCGNSGRDDGVARAD